MTVDRRTASGLTAGPGNDENPRPDLVVLPGASCWWAILGSNQ
jgi:hypothetical protein